MKITHAILVASGVLASLPAGAAAPAEPKVAAQIKQQFTKRWPNIQISAIEKSPIPGLYSVFTGQELVYTSANADYVLTGALIETSSGKNMTQELVDIHYSIDYSTLPFDQAIKIVKGSGERTMAVFSDPDCPYCQKLEKELGSVADTTVYIFLFPIPSLHPQAEEHAKNIWCAPQREQAWTRWMLEKSAPETTTCEGSPVKDLMALGEKLNIASTPTIFFPNGRRVSGAPTASQLVGMFKENTAQPAKAASSAAR